ncbi:MAG: hypothetical protein HS115_20170 [Spirochaetales bacterium]|nr:hypothetical protein [Spirochaetales bacterium]
MTIARTFTCLLVVGLLFPRSGKAQQEDPRPGEEPAWPDIKIPATTEEIKARAREKAESMISINPGLSVASHELRIHKPGSSAHMTGFANEPVYNLDLYSRTYQLTDLLGVQIIQHNATFLLSEQYVAASPLRPIFVFGANTYAEETDQKTENADRRRNERSRRREKAPDDVGTRIRGYTNIMMPTLYVGRKESVVRFGLGAGYGFVTMNGTVDFDNHFQKLAALRAAYEPNQVLPALSRYYLDSGLASMTGDPVIVHYAARLDEEDALEHLGMYLMATNIARLDPGEFLWMRFWVHQLSAHYGKAPVLNDSEIYALLAMQRGIVSMRNHPLAAVMAFLEVPYLIPHARLRLDYGVSFFRVEPFQYRLDTLNISVFVPVTF